MKTTRLFVTVFFSMSAYHRQRLKEEKKASLEQRRSRLRAMLQEEQDRLEAELREVVPDRSTLASQLVQKTEELRTAREERRKKVGDFLFSKTKQCLTFSVYHLLSLFFTPSLHKSFSGNTGRKTTQSYER